ncbi:hypothetical protein BDW22DRAFT_1351641 [Trametopsis cervina]|nr:hypothetical protein BDW22DRAFT_1351641 [Trametopsis cervina]
MDYTPRYPQPFTLGEAVHLDVPVISEEIARLENSLAHLQDTQTQLREANEESPDPEFEKAIQENEDVIGSQEERISMLRMALSAKGVPVSFHTSIGTAGVSSGPQGGDEGSVSTEPPRSPPAAMADTAATGSHDIVIDEDGGIDL